MLIQATALSLLKKVVCIRADFKWNHAAKY